MRHSRSMLSEELHAQTYNAKHLCLKNIVPNFKKKRKVMRLGSGCSIFFYTPRHRRAFVSIFTL